MSSLRMLNAYSTKMMCGTGHVDRANRMYIHREQNTNRRMVLSSFILLITYYLFYYTLEDQF
jgi:hypothetical protein